MEQSLDVKTFRFRQSQFTKQAVDNWDEGAFSGNGLPVGIIWLCW